MTQSELELYRRKLLTLAARLSGEVSELRGEALSPADGPDTSEPASAVHPTDLPGHETEEELTRTLLGNEEDILADVSEALARIGNGTYGRCLDCGTAVPRERLRAVPYARYCVNCARRPESKT